MMRCKICNNALTSFESVIKSTHGEYRDTCSNCESHITAVMSNYDDYLGGWSFQHDFKDLKKDE